MKKYLQGRWAVHKIVRKSARSIYEEEIEAKDAVTINIQGDFLITEIKRRYIRTEITYSDDMSWTRTKTKKNIKVNVINSDYWYFTDGPLALEMIVVKRESTSP